MNFLSFFLLFSYPFGILCLGQSKVKNIKINEVIQYLPSKSPGFFSSDLRIYCYEGIPKGLSCIFQSLHLEMDIDNDDFVLYEGTDEDDVKKHYDNQRLIFSINFFNTNKRKLIRLNPFNQTCVGIDTAHSYALRLNLIRIDFWKVSLLFIGLVIFWMAKGLSETPLFYYLSGILLGIFASFLVIVYFISKLFPKKPMMYGMMVGGWSLGIYFAQMISENFQMILMTYQSYVFWYIIITGFISFIVCYRFGPPTNQRSKNIIKWGLQFVAICMMYFSSHYKEAVIGIVIVVLYFFYFPKTVINQGRSLWYKRFPPKRRLLTNEEFYEQTARETTKALADLKRYCSSPESKPWKTMLKLKDAQRFAQFIEGSPHLLDSEVLDYETSRADFDSDISDDDDDDDDEEGNQMRQETVPQSSRLNSKNHRSFKNGINSPRTSTPITHSNFTRTQRNQLSQPEISDDDN